MVFLYLYVLVMFYFVNLSDLSGFLLRMSGFMIKCQYLLFFFLDGVWINSYYDFYLRYMGQNEVRVFDLSMCMRG